MARIQLIARNLPPLVGGMERLTLEVYRCLGRQHEVRVIGPQGCGAYLPNGVATEIPLQPLLGFLAGSFWAAWRQARRWRPDLVVGSSALVAPAVAAAAREAAAASMVFVHGLDLVARNGLYQAVFPRALKGADAVVANSGHTSELARARGVAAGRVHVVHPGVEWPRQLVSPTAARSALNLGSGPVLLSVGRLVRRKGLTELVHRSLPAIRRQHPDVALLVVGSEPLRALKRDGGYVARLDDTIRRNGLQGSVRLLGAVDDATLALAYAAADLLVFPVLDVPGDVEGFGMVAVEAAAHGVPTVGFAVGGLPDSIAHGQSGWLLSPGDYEGLARWVADFLAGDAAGLTPETCRQHAAAFRWERFGAEVQRVCDAVLRDRSIR